MDTDRDSLRREPPTIIQNPQLQKVNEAAVGLIAGLIGLRNLLALPWNKAPTNDEIFDVAWQLALAREAERPLSSDIVEVLSSEFKEASRENDESDPRLFRNGRERLVHP